MKLLPVASQMVALGAEAQAAVRAGQGLPEQLRLVTTNPIAEFVAGSLTEAFSRRFAQPVEASAGVAAEDEMAVLVVNRLADMALGPLLSDKELVSRAGVPLPHGRGDRPGRRASRGPSRAPRPAGPGWSTRPASTRAAT